MDYSARILVVEDEPGISGFIGTVLTANGYEVEKAANGKEALMMISSRKLRRTQRPQNQICLAKYKRKTNF